MSSTEIAVRFGRKVGLERKRRGLSIVDAAARSGVHHSVIRHLEHGERGCRLDSAVRLAAFFGISLDALAAPCPRCQDTPAPGYTCNACGAAGAEPQTKGRTP